MREILEVPVEATKLGLWVAAEGSRSMLRGLGETLLRHTQPDYIPPEIRQRQSILKQFEDRFAVVSNLMDGDTDGEDLDARISWAAHSLVDEGVVDDHTVLEVRSLLPEDSFYYPEIKKRQETVVKKLATVLEEQYGVQAIFFSHPITPTDHPESPVNATEAWGIIADELDGFSHQVETNPQRKLAMLAVTDSDYEHRIFDSQIVAEHAPPTSDELVVLRHVGANPADNLLLGRRHVGVLEHKELRDFQAPMN